MTVKRREEENKKKTAELSLWSNGQMIELLKNDFSSHNFLNEGKLTKNHATSTEFFDEKIL